MVRSPIQVDDAFRMRLKKIQEKIMRKKGKFESIPKITKDVVKMSEWDLIEKKLLGEIKQVEMKIHFDRRIK